MQINHVVQTKGIQVFTIHVEAIIYDALQVLNEKHIGALIVMDDRNEICGIITERDIMRCSLTYPSNIKGMPVKEAMTPKEKLVVCTADDDIDYVMKVMTEKRIRHIPVVSKDGSLQGIISVGDVIKALLSDKDHEIRYLKDYISNKYPV